MTTTVDLLTALGAHLAEFELPVTASVQVVAGILAPQVSVQLSRRTPSAMAQELLAWADTLTEVSAQAWRVPQRESVHLSVTGLLPGGAAVRVYGAMPITDCRPAADLAPDATTAVPLVILRHLAAPGQTMEEVIA